MTAFTTQPKPSHTCTTSPWARDQNSRGCHVSCKIPAFCNTLQPAPDVDACTSCARASCVQPDRASLGDTPLQWASRARVDAARALLGTTKLSVDQIAVRVGLGTGSNLRLHFRRILDVSPSEYRAAFSGRTILTP
ncbi:helix-turn-helix domain-containing protein [Streptomyces sp. T1317-0309]|nr:helix-turn-helix domain-containing protein [Streptomyces sp. T1317-0309]